jgi:hypothetical protein
MNTPTFCQHSKLPTAIFDAEKAKTMTAFEVRQAYPRLIARCPDCGETVVRYASQEHYHAGDY